MIKQLIIPVAAFAVTATAASAFGGGMLEKFEANLSDEQISALEEARELRLDGADRDEVHEVLEAAGLDQETMSEMRREAREYRQEHREEMRSAIEAEDYDAYRELVAETERPNVVDSEADFKKLVEAHELRQAGDHEAAGEIMTELGFERGEGGKFGGRQGGGKYSNEGSPRAEQGQGFGSKGGQR